MAAFCTQNGQPSTAATSATAVSVENMATAIWLSGSRAAAGPGSL